MRVVELRKALDALVGRGYGLAHTDVTAIKLYESEEGTIWPDEVELVIHQGAAT